MLRWTSWRGFVSLAGNNNGSERQPLPERSVFPHHSLPDRLPLQTTQSCIHNKNLPPKYQQQWEYLSGYTEITMVTCTYSIKSIIVYLLSSL